MTTQTAPVLIFPGLGDCDACADRRAEIVRRAYAERIVESGVKREWDRRDALATVPEPVDHLAGGASDAD